MNPININDLRHLYFKYREYLIHSGVILVCIILFIVVIIPQIKNLVQAIQNAEKNQKGIEILKNNVNFFSNLNDEKLDSEVKIVTSSLPAEKDFILILRSLSNVSSKARVSLGDFNFKIGELSTKSAQTTQKPSLSLSIILNGDARDTSRFLNELAKTLPLSEVTDIQVGSNQSTLNVHFYYKPFSKVVFDNEMPVSQRSKKNQEVMGLLSSWYNKVNFTPIVEESSSSGELK